ncbi:MAG: hypothetical protein HWN65_08585 [Candidatus Helarchaeota archaeon]|nr:hypothetical protein [Candidatus Helarchaeota archaeon]
MSEKILRVSKHLLRKKKAPAAIRYLFYGIHRDPNNVELFSCLGDALKQILEYEIALKIYRKGLKLAKDQENEALSEELTSKIENIYVISPEDALEGPQIGFFVRSLMKILSQLGKKDWF